MKQYFLCLFLINILSQTIFAQCSTYIQMIYHELEGCILPVNMETQQTLLPCPPFHEGYDDLSLGDYAYIDYKSSPGCSNFCQFGLPVEITCINIVTGIENQKKDLVIKMYPTIANSEVTIDGRNLKMVEFFDIKGMLVLRIEDLTSGVINVSNLSAGVYYVKVITTSGTRIFSLVKM